jgi:hypothetical protein
MGAKGLGIHYAMLVMAGAKEGPQLLRKNEIYSEAIESVIFMRKGWW